jgi:DNA-binding LacI/PurR family transcriptional regulator
VLPESKIMKKVPFVVTMQDVARYAGVSTASVSRALAGKGEVSERTKDRIHALARQMGYRVNPIARGLRSRVIGTIAVIVPLHHETRQSISEPFFMEILGHIVDALAEHDYSVLLTKVTSNAKDWIVKSVHTRQADGVIVIGQSVHHQAINDAAAAGLNIITWGEKVADAVYVSVGSNNEQGGYLATRHLLEQGCKKLVFLGDNRVPEVIARCQGYRRALEESNTSGVSATSHEVPVHFDGATAYKEIKEFLRSGSKVDGFFAVSDRIAISALRALREAGLAVPKDVAVVGYDGLPIAEFAAPALTTVNQNVETAGGLLANKLLAMIAGQTVESTVLPVELTVRQSSLRKSTA